MSFDSLDDDFYDRLEESLILADVGMDVALDATEKLRRRAYDDRLLTADQVKGALRDILAEKLEVGDSRLDLSTQPSVILVIGVNGVGKTTSIGKMAHQLKSRVKGAAVRRRYLPGCRRRPAGDLGGPGRGGHRPPE